jgi:hypothetical protein
MASNDNARDRGRGRYNESLARGLYRGLLSDLWEDEYIVSLHDSREVLFFIFCVINRRQSPAGVYRATPDQLWSDFRRPDVTVAEIEGWLQEFHEAGKVVSDGAWRWVVNFVRHRREINPSIAGAIVSYMNGCTSKLIFDAWVKKYRHYAMLPEFFDQLAKKGLELTYTGPEALGGPAAPGIPAEKPAKHLFDDQVRDVWGFYCETMHLHLTLTDPRRDKIIDRLKDKITDPDTGQIRATTVNDLFRAIAACANSDFHMGREEGKTRGKLFNVLERNILKDQEQLEQWLSKSPPRAAAPAPPRRRPPTREELQAPAGPVREFPAGAEEIKATADRLLTRIREASNGGDPQHEDEGEVTL